MEHLQLKDGPNFGVRSAATGVAGAMLLALVVALANQAEAQGPNFSQYTAREEGSKVELPVLAMCRLITRDVNHLDKIWRETGDLRTLEVMTPLRGLWLEHCPYSQSQAISALIQQMPESCEGNTREAWERSSLDSPPKWWHFPRLEGAPYPCASPRSILHRVSP